MNFNAEGIREGAPSATVGRELRPRRVDAASSPRRVKLGEVCEIIGGGTPSKKVSSYYEGDIPWASVRDMNCRFLSTTEFRITQKAVDESATNIIPAGEVIVSTHVGLGKVCILAQDTAINQDLKAIIPHGDVERSYLYFWFASKAKELIAAGKGATVKGVTVDYVKNLSIPLPPLPAQRRIAVELDRICELKRKAEEVVAKLSLLVKSRFVEMFGDCRANNRNFKLERIGSVAEVGSSKRIFQNEYVEAGVPFYRTKEIVELSHGRPITTELFITRERYEEIKSRYGVPLKGDLLVSAVGTIGEIWIVDGKREFYFKDGNLMQIRPSLNLDPIFMRHCLKILIDDFKRRIPQGTAYAALTIDMVKKMSLPLPPLSLQREFAAFVAQVDKLESAARRAVEKLDLLYRSRLQAHFGWEV